MPKLSILMYIIKQYVCFLSYIVWLLGSVICEFLYTKLTLH